MARHPLKKLQVVGIRYAGPRPVGPAQPALNAYRGADTYAAAGVPFEYSEPAVVQSGSAPSPAHAYGALNGAIAETVAAGRRNGRAILMSGGNCGHAPGVLGGLQDAHGADARIGLVWLDAHGDFNTPKTTLTGSLGGMPVAVCAGLALPEWREGAHMAVPLPTDRIVMTDLRNLDPAEAQLLAATDVTVTGAQEEFAGAAFNAAVDQLAAKVDMLYLHIDADILDVSYVPNHITGEPEGPNMAQVQQAIDIVQATGKVVALALVSIYFRNASVTDLASGVTLLKSSLEAWQRHSTAASQ